MERDKYFWRSLTRRVTTDHNARGHAVRCMDGGDVDNATSIREVKGIEAMRVPGRTIARRKEVATYLHNVDDSYKGDNYFLATIYDPDEDASFIFLAEAADGEEA